MPIDTPTAAVAITNLLATYAECIDTGNLEAAAELFAHAQIKVGQSSDTGLINSQQLLKVWQDGSLKQSLSNLVTISPGAKWYPLYLMSNWSNNPGWSHDANNHVYWDNVEIFSDRGSGASGSMADGTISAATTGVAPEAPSNVSVR